MEYTVTFKQAEPEIMPIDFEGTHLILSGTLAWFYRLFLTADCEEAAVRELRPFLMAEKNKAVSVPQQNTASIPSQGNI